MSYLCSHFLLLAYFSPPLPPTSSFLLLPLLSDPMYNSFSELECGWVFTPFIKLKKKNNCFSFTYQELPPQHKSYILLVPSVFSLRQCEGILARSTEKPDEIWRVTIRNEDQISQRTDGDQPPAKICSITLLILAEIFQKKGEKTKQLWHCFWRFQLHSVTLPRKKFLVDWRRAISKTCHEHESTWEPWQPELSIDKLGLRCSDDGQKSIQKGWFPHVEGGGR